MPTSKEAVVVVLLFISQKLHLGLSINHGSHERKRTEGYVMNGYEWKREEKRRERQDFIDEMDATLDSEHEAMGSMHAYRATTALEW